MDGATELSGAMSFGASGEPKGMVSNFNSEYLEMTDGNSFQITLTTDIQVSGLVCYNFM